jgi:hypothetical protein
MVTVQVVWSRRWLPLFRSNITAAKVSSMFTTTVRNSIHFHSPDDGLIRAETCREYRSYLIKTLSIVAKQKDYYLQLILRATRCKTL